jgi:hypothetical protein
MGDLPVPPADKLPTQIMGILKEELFNISLSNNLLRTQMASQYSRANGSNNNRTD